MVGSAEMAAVIGLGYVGLPVALAFARRMPGTVGFDVNPCRVADLRNVVDRNEETSEAELRAADLRVTTELSDLREVTFFVVAVPTPVDETRRPDLTPLVRASETVGRAIDQSSRDDVVGVFESTVYPGVTEDVCRPVIERASGKKRGQRSKLGYSPERINPGDKEHTLERITKVVSGEDDVTVHGVTAADGAIVDAGVHIAPTITDAEAAKVIENTQGDLNIEPTNDLAFSFDRKGVKTKDVLAAAGTKWHFLRFSPGLVGGHCIGVDPCSLTTMAEGLGYHPQVILAGRRVNDGMGAFVAQKLVKLLVNADIPVKAARVGVYGLTFKENVPDLRNSRVPDIVAERKTFGVIPLVYDPNAYRDDARHEYDIDVDEVVLKDLAGAVIAVAHDQFVADNDLPEGVRAGGGVVDVKGVVSPEQAAGRTLWSL
jgi:UDP-N-acetyl-D-galactosamine dehydrogenase